MKLISKILLFSLVFSFLQEGISQTYDKDYTVNYINDHVESSCKLFAEKKNLRIEYYSNGEALRMDYIFPETIDLENGVTFNKEEGALILSCYDKAGKCIERDIIKRDSKILYERSNLPMTCTDCDGTTEAMKHLIMLYLDKKHTRDTPFE